VLIKNKSTDFFLASVTASLSGYHDQNSRAIILETIHVHFCHVLIKNKSTDFFLASETES
jgi:hypothetical protein